MKNIIIIIAFVIFASVAQAKIKLPSILSSDMVLQQQTNVNIWGEATANSKVTIKTSWNNKTYITLANESGQWLQGVSTPKAGGPFNIVISDGTPTKLDNVLIGEVWLCSGQSNMTLMMNGGSGQPVFETADLINQARAERPIRIATVPFGQYSHVAQSDCTAKWEQNTPAAVGNSTAVGYFFANYLQKSLDVPVGIIHSSWGGSAIASWLPRECFESNYPNVNLSHLVEGAKYERPNREPTVLYNGMIAPLEKFTIKGVLWYQGEYDRRKPVGYDSMQVAMMNQWRKNFSNPDMPFYYVQITPYKYEDPDMWSIGYFYDSQANVMKMTDHTGMAVTIDVGDKDCIHPARKKQVGERLAYWALGDTYGAAIDYKSPQYKSMEIKGDAIVLLFDNVKNGMWSHDYAALKGFEIAGEDRVFYPAQAKFAQRGTQIIARSTKVPNPVAVRYCYRNYASGTIYHNNNLPLMPFRTDTWSDLIK